MLGVGATKSRILLASDCLVDGWLPDGHASVDEDAALGIDED